MAEYNVNDREIEQLRTATAYDSTGDKIGKVSQVYLDDQSGRPTWATVSTGLFGSKETFVPVDDANVQGDELRVPYTKDFVKDAPQVDADGHIDAAEERNLYAYYSRDYDAPVTGQVQERDTVDTDRQVRDTDRQVRNTDRGDDEGSVVRHEEEVNVGKERVATGNLRLRKHVVNEQQTVSVPVEREEYTLQREPIREGDNVGGKLGEEEVSVTTYEERPVVEKDVVAKERVGLDKDTVRENQQVTTNVAKEEVVLERDEDRKNR